MSKHLVAVGERDLAKRSHFGIEASVALYRSAANSDVSLDWVDTTSVDDQTVRDRVGHVTGIWCVPGSPYASTSGALSAIRYARENGIPFLGTCGNFNTP